MSNSSDIAGYTYNVENWTPSALIDAMVAAGELSPAARDMDPEDVLDQHAAALGIDRGDEYSFDSSEFPKVIFWDQVDMDHDWDWLGEEQPVHEVSVDWVPNNHGYPYRATCTCGWQSRTYAARHAAQLMADSHISEYA